MSSMLAQKSEAIKWNGHGYFQGQTGLIYIISTQKIPLMDGYFSLSRLNSSLLTIQK